MAGPAFGRERSGMPSIPSSGARPRGPRRARLARAERPLLLAGLALVTAHLLDLALSSS
jgi:hypothetical protein